MKITRRALAGLLSILTMAFAPGLVPYQAAAQVFAGATAGPSGAILRVPRIGAVSGAGLAPLSPAAGLAPSLTGGLSASSWSAPSMTVPLVVNPALVRATVSAAAIPSLLVSPDSSVVAKISFVLAGDRLSAAEGAEKMGVLDFFFTGARQIYGRLGRLPTNFGSAASASLVGTGLKLGDKFLSAAAEDKPSVPAPAPAASDAAVGARALKWMYVQDAISMSVFILTMIAYPMVVIPAVGAVTFGVLMGLGPLASIALGPLSGMIATRFAPREGLAILSALRAVLAGALPVMALTGMISFWPLLVASIANGWQFSLLMTSRSAYTRHFAIIDPKQTRSWLHIGNLTTIGFSIYFLLQVLLGSIGQIGGLVDAMNPMTPFWISAAVHAGLVGLDLWKIPKTANFVSNAVGAAKAAAEPFAKKAASFLKTFWKEIALLAGSVGVYMWGLPLALPIIGAGRGSPLWIAGALMLWISRTDTFRSVMSTPKIRNALLLSALAAGLVYPFQNLAMPLIAASLGAKALIYGQLLGAFFFGQLLSNASMARLPEVRIPLINKMVAAEKLIQVGVLALAAIWAGVRLFPGSILAAAGAVAIGMAAIALTSRLTNRGWIKFYGVGLMAAVGVALSWGFYPGVFASVMLLGLFVGPFVSAINAYISGNSDPKMVSQTFGVSSSLFNALTSFGYGLMTLNVQVHGSPAFPGALTPIMIAYLLAGVVFFFAPRWLPGLPEKSFHRLAPHKSEPKEPAAAS